MFFTPCISLQLHTHTHTHTGRSSSPPLQNKTHPPQSLGRLHPGGFPVQAQRCPHGMIEHHFESNSWKLVSFSHCPLSLAARRPGDAHSCSTDKPLCALTARQPFPFKRQLPHPKPLHSVLPINCMQTKTTASPSVSKPCCCCCCCCMARTLTGP